MTISDQITDETFLKQFENLTLDSKYFNHIGHIRLAWLYITQYGLESAMAKIFVGIPAYAGSLGASDKFHATITDAIVRIIAKRMAVGDENSWQTFVEHNSDLVGDNPNYEFESQIPMNGNNLLLSENGSIAHVGRLKGTSYKQGVISRDQPMRFP